MISSWLETKRVFVLPSFSYSWTSSEEDFHFCLYSGVLNNATWFKQKLNVTSVKTFYTALYNSFMFLYKYKNPQRLPREGEGM